MKQSTNFAAQALSHEARADRLRKAAGQTDDVLSVIVGKLDCPLRVEGGRLVLTTDRGTELFEDLSDGERWRLALDVVIRFLPQNGILTLPQAAYGELDPINRREIDRLLRERGVVCLTAKATEDEELRAEVFQEWEKFKEDVAKGKA